ncbi:DUF2927 domain-containing protein [Sutcliffiella cohnii]
MNFQFVDFSIVEEEGVTYSATINGKPVNLNDRFEEEGTHTIQIQAIKENGLVTSRESIFTIDNRTYSNKEIKQFTDFYFEENPKTIKWEDSIELFIHGQPTSKDLQIVNNNVKELNDLLPFEIIVKGQGEKSTLTNKMDMYFVPNHKFKDYGFTGNLAQGQYEIIGLALLTTFSEREIYGSDILIATNTTQKVRETIILHELVHALGFYGHTDDKTSILYPHATTSVTTLSDFDKNLIEILYRAEIKSSMLQHQLERVLEVRLVE